MPGPGESPAASSAEIPLHFQTVLLAFTLSSIKLFVVAHESQGFLEKEKTTGTMGALEIVFDCTNFLCIILSWLLHCPALLPSSRTSLPLYHIVPALSETRRAAIFSSKAPKRSNAWRVYVSSDIISLWGEKILTLVFIWEPACYLFI